LAKTCEIAVVLERTVKDLGTGAKSPPATTHNRKKKFFQKTKQLEISVTNWCFFT